ncbi:MAG: MMPL family transporter [Deltaproteobacteria bacterium]|nr:MMPL family transporter [Deltaproteobacteria bacterium]
MDSSNFYMRRLVAWVNRVTGQPVLTLVVAGLTVFAAAWYSAVNVRMNSDNTKLVRQDTPFREDYHDFLDSFPQFRDTTLIVLTGESVDVVSDAQELLAAALGERNDLVSYLYAAGTDPYFEDHAFLYLDEEELEDAIERLARAQPALAALTEDPSLRGLFGELELGIENVSEGDEPPRGMIRMSKRVSDIGESMLAGRPRALAWSDEFFDEEETVYRLIVVRGLEDFDVAAPAERLLSEIRRTATELYLTPENGVRIRLTGMIPLAHEELATVRTGLALAGALSAVLLVVILGFGLRSLRIIVATMVALLASLAWTTAYAMATVGEFNTISAAFAILLLGLGVDFGVHIGLRYEEETYRGLSVSAALDRATAGTGGAISLCALTSAIGFASFIPTEYRGLAALGAIAGGGMLFSLIASFTLFPAVLALMGPPSHYARAGENEGLRVRDWIARHAATIVLSAGVLAIVATFIDVRYLTFDFSTLAMKDPDGEGMVTLRELHEQEIVTDYSLTVLAPDREAAEALAVELGALEEVTEARAPSYFVPSAQADKLLMLEDAAFFLEGVLYPEPAIEPPTDAERLASFATLREAIRTLPQNAGGAALHASMRRLADLLDAVLNDPDSERRARELEALMIDGLAERMEWLRRAMSVETVGFDDLPASLRERLIDIEGRHSVVALPSGDMSDAMELRGFVDAVASIAPHAAGRPSVESGIGEIVVRSFRLAIGLAFVAILAILIVSLRSVVDALMVLMPIILAALVTITMGILFDVPFTMANVVAIPLILGLGVDSGIHVFMRYRQDGAFVDMMSSSTPRAVLLSALTTLAAFASLSLSPHPGISGLGLLLSISVIALLYCTLIVLPAMIELRDRWRVKGGATR